MLCRFLLISDSCASTCCSYSIYWDRAESLLCDKAESTIRIFENSFMVWRQEYNKKTKQKRLRLINNNRFFGCLIFFFTSNLLECVWHNYDANAFRSFCARNHFTSIEELRQFNIALNLVNYSIYEYIIIYFVHSESMESLCNLSKKKITTHLFILEEK